LRDVLAYLIRQIDYPKKNIKGLPLVTASEFFSVGANIGMIFMMAVEQEYDELNMAIKMFPRHDDVYVTWNSCTVAPRTE
jgi:3-hydroxyacyl-CoA dehydrogenase